MTEIVEVAGYDPIRGADQEEADVELHIKGTPLNFCYDDAGFRASIEYWEEQAERVVQVLVRYLPQATVHRVLVQLLEQYAHHYRGKTEIPQQEVQRE